MVSIVAKPDTQRKLEILSTDAQYDLACACGSAKDEHRKRSGQGRWIYPITLPNGGTSILFKTLLSNVCTSDCKYCPLRGQHDIPRCTLAVEETANVFLDYYNQQKVYGLFLTSGVLGTPDATMDRLNGVARLLRRRHAFKGYIHLKIIPGASHAAIEDALSLASAVSLNIETPGRDYLAKLSTQKRYIEDIIEPIKLISRLTTRGARYHRVKQTTQFIVGAAGETDAEIVKYTHGLYDRLKMHRVYFSAYQRGLDDEPITAQHAAGSTADVLTREHRLYQVDFLFRKYGFGENDIYFEKDGGLSLTTDPKQIYAQRHPEVFPVNVNTASKWLLLKVPGLGPLTVARILERRKLARLGSIDDLGKPSARLQKAQNYIVF